MPTTAECEMPTTADCGLPTTAECELPSTADCELTTAAECDYPQPPIVNYPQPPIVNSVSSAGCGLATSTACDSVTCADCGSATSAVRDEVTCAGYGSATFVTTTVSHIRPTSDCRTADWFDRFRGVLRRIRLRNFEDMLIATLSTTYSKISPNGPTKLRIRNETYLNDVFGLIYGFLRSRRFFSLLLLLVNDLGGGKTAGDCERIERETREKRVCVCFGCKK